MIVTPWYLCVGLTTSITVALNKICGVFFPLHAVIVHVSWSDSEPRKLMTYRYQSSIWDKNLTSVSSALLYIHKEIGFTVSSVTSICSCGYFVTTLSATLTWEKSLWNLRLPWPLSYKQQNTVCWGKSNDCSEAEHDCLQAPLPLRKVQQPFQWGSSWQDRGGHLGEVHCATRICKSFIKTWTSYISFSRNQHQCFKQSHIKTK